LNNQLSHCDTELAFKLLDKYKFGFVHYVLVKSGRPTRTGQENENIRGVKIKEYLEFGYKNIKSYKSVNFTNQELDSLREYYASAIMNFIVTRFANFGWSDIQNILIDTPEDIKKELKHKFYRNFMNYLKMYFKTILTRRHY